MVIVRSKPEPCITERYLQRRLFVEFQSGSMAIMPNYTPCRWQECDVWRVTKSRYAYEYEIKVTLADFRADFKKGWKHRQLVDRVTAGPSRFWYVAPAGIILHNELPFYAGLLEWTRGGFVIVRDAPRQHTSKVGLEQIEHAMRACYYRLWTERERHDRTRARLTSLLNKIGTDNGDS